MIELDNIYNIDCELGINMLLDNSINLLITSPPYNVDIKYDNYNDAKDYNVYISWLKNIFAKVKPKLTDDGRVAINVGNLNNGQIPLMSDIIQFMKEIGYNNYSTIIWNKNHTSIRTTWGSWLSPSCPSFPTMFEYILIFYNKSRKLIHNGITDLTKQEFIDFANAMWNIKPVNKNDIHPAMFPSELPYRLIKMLSYKNDTILDIFSGSGTTCHVACELNRRFIGFELSEIYFKDSIKTLHSIVDRKQFFE